jgi:hypothetical protein
MIAILGRTHSGRVLGAKSIRFFFGMRRVRTAGHLQYYAVPLNWRALFTFCGQVERLWHRALARRSQRGYVPWAQMQRLRRRWLPSPRIVHPYPIQRFDGRT